MFTLTVERVWHTKRKRDLRTYAGTSVAIAAQMSADAGALRRAGYVLADISAAADGHGLTQTWVNAHYRREAVLAITWP